MRSIKYLVQNVNVTVNFSSLTTDWLDDHSSFIKMWWDIRKVNKLDVWVSIRAISRQVVARYKKDLLTEKSQANSSKISVQISKKKKSAFNYPKSSGRWFEENEE